MPRAANEARADPPEPVPLTSLRPGDRGRLHDSALDPRDRQLLTALGLAPKSPLRLCKAGDPWIIEVRSTRIGLAEAVARDLMVLPEGI